MSSLIFLSLRIVLDIAQDGSSQDSRTVKLQKEEFKTSRLNRSKVDFYRIQIRPESLQNVRVCVQHY